MRRLYQLSNRPILPKNRVKPEQKKKRAAAYCRVSTKQDLQDGSFDMQCTYFQRKIQEDPDLELAGIYGDHGKSGRAVKGRKELDRLLKDCKAGLGGFRCL